MEDQLAAWILLLVGAGSGLTTFNAFRPVKVNPVVLVVSFFSSWWTAELAMHQLVSLVAVAVFLVAMGALGHWAGAFGLALVVVSCVGLAVLWRKGHGAEAIVRQALEAVVTDHHEWPRVPGAKLINPFAFGRRGVRKVKNVAFCDVDGHCLELDVYLPPEREGESEPASPRPAILQIHGGAWVLGDKREQGLPLLAHMAANGWVGFNANYRLSPRATFPEHLIDVKRALAWVRENAESYGVDPGFIAVTGGSAGGHLTALMGLTGNDPRYQPGFEEADTSVQAAVPFYGVYDFTDRQRLMGRPFRHLLERVIMKLPFEDNPEAYRDASPLDLVHEGAPPFFIIHGDQDILAPVQYARLFAETLAETSASPVYYAEVEGAQHAFDVFFSPRTARVIEGVERFLTGLAAARAPGRGQLGSSQPEGVGQGGLHVEPSGFRGEDE